MSDSEYEYIDVPLRLKVPRRREEEITATIIPFKEEMPTQSGIVQRPVNHPIIIANTLLHEVDESQPNIQISPSSTDEWGVDPEAEKGAVFQAQDYYAATTLLALSGGGVWQSRRGEGRELLGGVVGDDVQAALLNTNPILATSACDSGGGSKVYSEIFIVGNPESCNNGLGIPEAPQVGSAQETRLVGAGQQQDISDLEESSIQYVNWAIIDLGTQGSGVVENGQPCGGEGTQDPREDELERVMNIELMNIDLRNLGDEGPEPAGPDQSDGVQVSLRTSEGKEPRFPDVGQGYDEFIDWTLAGDSVDFCQFVGFESTGVEQAHQDLEPTEDDLQIQQIVNDCLQGFQNNDKDYFQFMSPGTSDHQVDRSILEGQYDFRNDPQSLLRSQPHDPYDIDNTIPDNGLMVAGYVGTDSAGLERAQTPSYKATGTAEKMDGDVLEDGYALMKTESFCICCPTMGFSLGSCPTCSLGKDIEFGLAGSASGSEARTIRARPSSLIQAEVAPRGETEDDISPTIKLLHYDSGSTESPMQIYGESSKGSTPLDRSSFNSYLETGGATSPQAPPSSDPSDTNEVQANHTSPLTGGAQTAYGPQQERLPNTQMSGSPMYILGESMGGGTPSFSSLFGDYSDFNMDELSANAASVNTFSPFPGNRTGFISNVTEEPDTDMESEESDETSGTDDGEEATPQESDNSLFQTGRYSSMDSDLGVTGVEQVVVQYGLDESMDGTEKEDDKEACDCAMTEADEQETDGGSRGRRQEAEDEDYDGDNSDQEMQDNGNFNCCGWPESDSNEVTPSRASGLATPLPRSTSDMGIYVPPPTPGRVGGLSLISQSRFRVGDTPPRIDDRACWIGGVETDMSTHYPGTNDIRPDDPQSMSESSHPPSTVVYKGRTYKRVD